MMEARSFPVSAGTEVRSVDVAGIPAEWVWWPGAAEGWRVLYLHGGGYFMGSPVTHRELAGRLSRASGCVMLVLDYRLAPEAPFPAAVEDAMSAIVWMREHGPSGLSLADAIAVAGDSAGGGLALATLVSLRDRGDPLPGGALLMSPWADLLTSGDSYARFPSPTLHRNVEWYLNGADPRDPLASPIYADFTGLPPLMIQAGEAESFLDDSITIAERARDAGGEVTLEVWPEMIHVFQSYAPLIPEGREAIDRAGNFLRQCLAPRLVPS